MLEVGAFTPVGYGPWRSTAQPLKESLVWSENPWEIVAKSDLERQNIDVTGVSGKSVKVLTCDPVIGGAQLTCGSSTELNSIPSTSLDLVVSDPPFGEIMQYAELADFFYVWLRIAFSVDYPNEFAAN